MDGYDDGQEENPLLVKNAAKVNSFREYIPTRVVFTLLGFLGFTNVYALRVNLSVAMVAMINGTAIHSGKNVSSTECLENYNSTQPIIRKDGPFSWDEETQGIILGAFFWGYVITQVPGGRIAEQFGSKWLFGGGILCTAILTLLTPLAAYWHENAFIVVRILEGLGEGVTFPAMHIMIARWVPKSERSLISAIIYSGSQIGTVIAMPISGVLCDSTFLGGWPSVFYVFGALGCVWFIAWVCLIYETPLQHPRISKSELLYILQDQGSEQSHQKAEIPWKKILTSVPVWALIITHFGQNWGFYTLLTELPSYMKEILHYDIKENAFLSALPYLMQGVISWPAAILADAIRRRQLASTSVIRKVSNSIAFLGPAICLIGVTFARCNHSVSVLLFTLAMGMNGLSYSGYCVTHVDMAPDFAGTLMGMTNGVANLAGIFAPYVVGVLTNKKQTLAQWAIAFYISSGIYVITSIIFIVFGSAKLQSWGVSQETNPTTSSCAITPTEGLSPLESDSSVEQQSIKKK